MATRRPFHTHSSEQWAGRWSGTQAGRERGPWLPPATTLTLLGKAEEVGEEPPDAPERELGSCEDQWYPRRSHAVSHRVSAHGFSK